MIAQLRWRRDGEKLAGRGGDGDVMAAAAM
jgi:hypothetical protein